MKVALIGPVYPYRGGISHHTTMLARHLSAVSECRVISFKRQYPKRIYPGRTDIDPSREIMQVDAEYGLDLSIHSRGLTLRATWLVGTLIE